ncbi:MAG: hypothetical protein KGM99_11685 [Burkholderiales bacterium]|nr:hypothetical protein [Burkholderiales bacterium]
MFDRHGIVRNLVLEQRIVLNDMTDNVDKQMTIAVVTMLFEFVVSDTQILTLEEQGKSSIVSLRVLRRMIKHGRLRYLESEPLLDRAIQSRLNQQTQPTKPHRWPDRGFSQLLTSRYTRQFLFFYCCRSPD